MEYRKLHIWQESFQIAVDVHRLFVSCKDFGFKDQISRSSVSVPSNIAEGEERETRKESVRFLYYAKGSCGELVTQLLLAKEFGYIGQDEADELVVRANIVSRKIASLIKFRSGQVKESSGIYDVSEFGISEKYQD
ncbi:four helix bundle protein [Photobacterium rosenbergii]|uniref:Four helix bundle protein n=1 Tax=Photobacterium rosenbergii TaxID=294936 RepID=A0ABU3ZM28_9GAMM|nr:four helix bundle protein [Photobacterium rosenbergii]MDV5171087.1 four helix bundle protein [Photobacterium rosenbergii]